MANDLVKTTKKHRKEHRRYGCAPFLTHDADSKSVWCLYCGLKNHYDIKTTKVWNDSYVPFKKGTRSWRSFWITLCTGLVFLGVCFYLILTR